MPVIDDGGTALWFGVLGPVQVRRQGAEIDLGPRQQRLILALLLANAGQPVGINDIVDVLWDQRPPPSAVNVVHRYVGAIRRSFEPGLAPRSAGRWLLGDAAGYRMRVDAENLDLLHVRRLAEQARSDEEAGRLTEAMSAYETALGRWRGPCAGISELATFDHLAFGVVDHECADLVRAAATLAVRLDRARSVLSVLRRMAEQRPWDEALQAQLLLALSADGKRAEAITLYQNVRGRLADELGVDPGEELREAFQRVLRQDSAEPGPSPVPGRLRIAGVRATHRVLPAQLPADLPHFTGRDEARHRTLSVVNGQVLARVSMPVLAIDGIPGIGKTSLAIHLSHQLADAHPDGQLYVDLRGFDPGRVALPPAEALHLFLNALGVPDAEIPANLDARSGLYRSVLAGRRILILLDNAHDVEQVRPLLPGAPGCLVLVTSRRRLTGLATAHGARLMTLDVLSADEARAFLIARVGAARTADDPRALDEIVERCGRLPLALAVVAARALTHPDLRLTDVARELRETRGSLDGFSGDDVSSDIRTVFSWSYQRLGVRAARTFRLLSLHPGADVTLSAMAGLAGEPPAEMRALAGELVRTGLITEYRPGRFSTHDLIRAYAQELMRSHDDEPDRDRATRRLVQHHQLAADRLLDPTTPREPPPTVVAPARNAADEAVAWLTADREVLTATVHREIDEGRPATTARACPRAASAARDHPGRAHGSRSTLGPVTFAQGNHPDSVARLRVPRRYGPQPPR
ncbi:DNA-binding transcriptional activator of the SARP family [Cryptosporangium arvum DSM 44712]|uniref:DNA-binding transcriptional activator of the SARP family n=1 Tax=Cryptosporangium arvum DSM 44712 TaxID=927661 RepID=A0A011AKA2_9ACTN|nr:DNA-binding transcriptional activator of the SARP family [Cryptosporangium arvum DSM 44712]